MKKSQKAEFTAMILGIGLIYEKEITKPVSDLYWSALSDLELVEVEKALQLHMKDPDAGRFMPKPADIRRHACRGTKTGVIAWMEVQRALVKYNTYDSVQFQDGTINLVIKDMGGWVWLSNQMDSDEPWTQKEFEKLYDLYKARGMGLNERLVGLHEAGNRNTGYLDYIPDTKLIAEDGSVKALPAPGSVAKELPEMDKSVKLLTAKMSMPDGEEKK